MSSPACSASPIMNKLQPPALIPLCLNTKRPACRMRRATGSIDPGVMPKIMIWLSAHRLGRLLRARRQERIGDLGLTARQRLQKGGDGRHIILA